MAGLLIGLLIITSGLIAGAVVTHHASLLLLPWTDRFSLDSRLSPRTPPVIYETAMVIEQASRKVYPYSIVPGGALNLDEAKRAMNEPSVKSDYANFNFVQLRQVKLAKNLLDYLCRLGREECMEFKDADCSRWRNSLHGRCAFGKGALPELLLPVSNAAHPPG